MSLIHDKTLRGHGKLSPAKTRSTGAGAAKSRAVAGTPAKARSSGNAPTVSEEGQRRRRIALLILILLLMLGSFWIGRASFQGPAPLPPAPVLAVAAPAPAAVGAPPVVTTPVAAKATATVVAAAAASIPTGVTVTAGGPETALLEVTVGTTMRGGLTLKFDHPVNWTVDSTAGSPRAEIDVQGVHALGTFPRNLPMPPGVKAIHAGITAPETLNLGFDLRPGIQAYTSPVNGPSAVLNVYFRTPIEQAAIESQSQAGETGACGASGSVASFKVMKLLRQSLAGNPGNTDVRTALALLQTCSGDGVQAEKLMAEGVKAGSTGGVRIAVVDATLLLAGGDTGAAIQVLKANAPPKGQDAGYSELRADFEAAAGKP